jgi:hypothetical protein
MEVVPDAQSDDRQDSIATSAPAAGGTDAGVHAGLRKRASGAVKGVHMHVRKHMVLGGTLRQENRSLGDGHFVELNFTQFLVVAVVLMLAHVTGRAPCPSALQHARVHIDDRAKHLKLCVNSSSVVAGIVAMYFRGRAEINQVRKI